MSIISLISDWQKNDYYSAVVKARILSKHPDANILEINNQVESFDINQAAFILSSSLEDFPSESIHIVAIKSHEESKKGFLIGQYKEQFIICADNNLLNSLQQEMEAIYLVNQKLSTFPEADQFAPTAVLLAENVHPSDIGTLQTRKSINSKSGPIIDENKITTKISYIDSYGNAHLNLNKEDFELARNGRGFSIFFKSMSDKIDSISENYNEVPTSSPFAIFNSAGFLEIGINIGNIAEQHELKELESIFIMFRNELF